VGSGAISSVRLRRWLPELTRCRTRLGQPVLVGCGFCPDCVRELGVESFVEFVDLGFVEISVDVVVFGLVVGVGAVGQVAAVYPVEEVFEQVVSGACGVEERDVRLGRTASRMISVGRTRLRRRRLLQRLGASALRLRLLRSGQSR
jgi:hypothetical protein